MKQALTLTAIISLLTVAAGQAQTYQTNLVQNLNIQLAGVKQGPTTTNGNFITTATIDVTLGTGDIIKALGAATGNTFSREAALVVVTPLPAGSPSVAVQDGANTVNVSSFVWFQALSGQVDTSVANTRTGRSTSSGYGIEQFVLQDGSAPLNIHFNVTGVATENFFESPGLLGQGSMDVTVSGAGDRNGNLLILEGTVGIHGQTLQVVEVQSGPPNT